MIPKYVSLVLAASLLVASCKSDNKQNQQESAESKSAAELVKTPDFNADSAYAYVDAQVAFGPRVPNTEAHRRAGDYLIAKLKQLGATVTVQEFKATTYDGKTLNSRNIIGSLNPQAAKRILLASHWDSRPFADNDTTAADRKKPVPGANDGASGVGVLLELARSIQQGNIKPTVGIDLIFFDAEDWGNSELAKDEYGGFCLGSRHWAANKHQPNYTAYYGVLLDMVGAQNATFFKEGNSMQYAPSIVNQIWQTASDMGYSQYFVDQLGSAITDDHVPVNTIAKIPMIDIIHTQPGTGAFFPHWHTDTDNMAPIDRATLKAVGQVLLQTLYRENQ
ncbi:M28 family peptidase [Tellurirhabdus rosea]|uniref:M28 family peptidase n=1 Tax=Tellurirhabdus rosea TaxID=2674997 RepID=UPI00224D6698|nr:M28 family peptidase [Tellurirhabdus rosea]